MCKEINFSEINIFAELNMRGPEKLYITSNNTEILF